jgi:hypothetical protein
MGTEENLSAMPGKKGEESGQEIKENGRFKRFLIRNSQYLWAGWTLAILLFLAVIPSVYYFWFVLVPDLWSWMLDGWWHFIPAFFGFVLLFCIPLWVGMAGYGVTGILLDVYLEIEESGVKEIRNTARIAEEEALSHFSIEDKDTADLIRLLKNSRTDLEAYHKIGLNQSRRSFRNSVLAMWLGFLLLLAGIVLYVAPVEQLGIGIPDTSGYNFLIIGGAAIIEFVAALFLWVYRSTSNQLQIFYDREMHKHSIVLCYKIASTIKEPDDAKRSIIDKVLERKWVYSEIEPTNSKGFRKLFKMSQNKS